MSCIYQYCIRFKQVGLLSTSPLPFQSPGHSISRALLEPTCLSFTSHAFTEVPLLQQDYLNNATFNTDNYFANLNFQSLSLKKGLKSNF